MVDGEITLKSAKNDEKVVDIKVMKSNYVLQLSVKTNEETIGSSKTFYSNAKLERLLDRVSKSISTDNDNSIRLKLVLTDKETKISKTQYIQVENSGDIRDLLNHIKADVMKNRICVEPKLNRFRIIIENSSSIQNDKKSVSINCNDDMKQVISGLKFLFGEIIKEQLDTMVVFADDQKSNATHRILVQKCDEKSKAFSIVLNNYSSSEVAELLVDKIRGKRK